MNKILALSAVDNGNRFIIGYLLGLGSPKNVTDTEGMTPLDIAIRNTAPRKGTHTPAPYTYYDEKKDLVTHLRKLGFEESE